MSKPSSLSKNLIIYLIGNAGVRLSSLILLPLFTAYLSTDEYGYFELVYTIVLFFAPAVSLQLYEGVIRFLIGDDDSNKKDSKIVTTSFAISLVTLTIFNILFLTTAYFIEIPYYLHSIIFFNLFYLVNYFLRIARGLEKKNIFATANILTSVYLVLVSFTIIYFYEFNLEGILTSYILAYFFTLISLILMLKVTQYIKLNFWDAAIGKSLLIYSIPLILDSASWWIINLSDRILIKYFLGDSAIGIYGVANKFSSILLFTNVVFYMAWQDHAIKTASGKDYIKEVTNTFNKLIKIQFSGFMILIFFSKVYIYYFINNNFIEAALYVPLLTGGALFAIFSAFFSLKYQVEKNTKSAFYSSFIAAILNVSLNFYLIPEYGIYGAAVSTIIAYIVFWLIRMPYSQKFINLKEVNWHHFAIGIILCGICSYLYFSLDIIYGQVVLGLTILLFFLINKEFVKEITSKILKRK